VSGHDARLEGDTELVELPGCVFHHFPVALAAHRDPDQRSFHELSL
jgi:hypothetical protein